jgi:putative ABC transport system permease protein
MHTANQSVLSAFSQTVDRIAGKTELEVTSGDAGFGEDVLEKVQSASTVRAAVPVIEAVVDSNIQGQGSLLVLGIDMTGDRSLREYDLEEGDDAVVDDPLVFLAQPDSLIVSSAFAGRNGLATGGRLRLGTVEGEKTFTVRGIMKASGLASAFGGNLAIMDVYAAQQMFGRGRTFDRIDVAVNPGMTLAECERELAALLGPGFDIRPPSGRGQQFEAMLAAYSTMVNISSAFALFIGMFIIYNAFQMAVTQRRSEIGILRALGATSRQIRTLFLGESAVIGLAGSIVGLGVGIVIARAIASSLGGLIADFFRVAQQVEDVATDPSVLALAVGVGIATSLVAAAIPARDAARVDPVDALRRGGAYALAPAQSRFRMVAALACGASALAALTIAESGLAVYMGYASTVVAMLLVGPMLSVGLTRAIRPVLKWVRPVEGSLAAESLIQSPRRTSASVAALMLSLGLVVAFEGIARANYNSIIDWTDTALNPDLFVVPSQNLDTRSLRFPPTMAEEISAVPGVERVQMLRNARVPFRETPVMVVALEMSSIAQTVRPPVVAGTLEEMYRKSAAGEGLLVSDNFAQLQQLALGDIVEIAAPYGIIRLPVVGVIVDYSDHQGSILMDRTVFMKYWQDESVNMFRVYVNADASPAVVRERILERYDGRRQVFVLTNGELKAYITSLIGDWFQVTSVQIAVAVLVAILGIVNTLTVSITDRRRELGILRAVGAWSGQVRRTIWLEALVLGTLGLILGCALGAINLYYLLEIVHRDVSGLRLDYEFPLSTALALVPAILAAALVAAVWPAESAVRGPLLEALEYE